MDVVRVELVIALRSAASDIVHPLARFWASGETNIQQTNALVWVMVGMSVTGAIITFSFLVYSLWKFRDPQVRGRRYG
ncbi:MAG TPA: hypothetical protein VEG42_03505 [Thermoplasmata archaeon]|nr:hypothetical protein [Thermoplasmata archaeon]